MSLNRHPRISRPGNNPRRRPRQRSRLVDVRHLLVRAFAWRYSFQRARQSRHSLQRRRPAAQVPRRPASQHGGARPSTRAADEGTS
ncbi:hypothetical protein Nepgr_027959 [Nepenthes gracilis]|uniref:Uncharacterized protein n=1 Tax=Nepenthes gracilis TaxID=150966 RepID=A0AAD3Y436_NEPGR|nr:hypothetical protein Nepgr_027959 [Nepenthes gracilis]